MLLLTTGACVILAAVVYFWTYSPLRNRNKTSMEHGKPFHLPVPEEALPHWKGKRLTPLSLVSPSDPSRANIQCYCPATGQYLGSVKAHTRQDINDMVQSAATAQAEWRKTSFVQRRRVLGSMTRYLIDNQTEIARVACRDSGKTMVDAALGEIMVTLEKIKWITTHGEAALAPSKRARPSNPLLMYKAAQVVYEPLGVVAALVSWNYPLHNLLGPVVASIFCGNGIVVKCSEQVAWSSRFFVEIARRALSANGYSPDLVQLVHCWGPEANHVTAHPKISHVTFIGSGPVAQQVVLASGGYNAGSAPAVSNSIPLPSSPQTSNCAANSSNFSQNAAPAPLTPLAATPASPLLSTPRTASHPGSSPGSIKDAEGISEEVIEVVNNNIDRPLGVPLDARQPRASVSSQMSTTSYKSLVRENSVNDLASLAGPAPSVTGESVSVPTISPRIRFPQLVVELGGKDPAIVLDDVSDDRIKEIASVLMRGTFQNAGQNCIGIERVIALPHSYDRLLPILETAVKSLRVGSAIDQQEGVDMGATISDNRFGALEQLISAAVDEGAQLICGGSRHVHPKYPQGHYFSPTFLCGVTRDMDIAQQEVFAPILLLMRAESVEDAVAIANSTEYGLGASIFGSSRKTMWHISSQLECGSVALNDFATYALCQLPFGGAKASGYGKFGGKEGLRGLCNEKSICYDRVSFIKTIIPAKLDYPISNVQSAWEMVKAINEAGYGYSLWRRVKAILKLARD